MTNKNTKIAGSVAGALAIILLACPAFAAPAATLPVTSVTNSNPGTTNVAASGKVTVKNYGTYQSVKQSTGTAIVDWKSFNIGSKTGASEWVNISQPSSSSVILGRISGSASQIYGTLTANGNVILANGNGINFKTGSVVNVGGLIATTSSISNDEFNSSSDFKYAFTPGANGKAEIVNDGRISVKDGGLVALVAPVVRNNWGGVIVAKLGKVHVGSGDTFTVDLYGDGLINLQASDNVQKQLINNSGRIYADGGEVLLTAAAAKNVVDSQINMAGLIQADTVGKRNGKIVLEANSIQVDGDLYARGSACKGETGGSILIDGVNVGLCNCATLDATGKEKTGTGQITVIADNLESEWGLKIRTNENVTFEPHSDATTIAVAGTKKNPVVGQLQITRDVLDGTTAKSITIGNTTRDSGTMRVGTYEWRVQQLNLLNHTGDIVIEGVQTMDYSEKGRGDRKPTMKSGKFLAHTVEGDITIGSSGAIRSSAFGDAVVLAASGGKFLNYAGADAIWAMNTKGRWLVYSNNPADNVFGGLDSQNYAVWNTVYDGSSPAQKGNLYLFAYQPTLEFVVADKFKKVGTVFSDYTYTVAGLHLGVEGAFKADTMDRAFSGTPAMTSAGSPALAPVGGYDIDLTGVSGENGYKVAVVPGVLTVEAMFPAESVYRGTTPGRRQQTGTLLSIVNTGSANLGNLADLAPAAGGDEEGLAGLAPAAGGTSGVTPLIQCNEITPCDLNQ